MRQQVVDTALEHPESSPRELAWQITDTQGYFISESSVYRILKRCDLITSPAYIVMSASDQFQHPTRRVNELWQTDFTYFRVVGWGWYYLSTVLDDYSRYIIAWKLFQTMAASDVQETLDPALEATRISQGPGATSSTVAQRQWALLRGSRSKRVSSATRDGAHARGAVPSHDSGEDRALPSFDEETWSSWNTTTIPGNWSRRSSNGSNTTTTVGITNLWTTSHRRTCSLAVSRKSSPVGRASSAEP